jgi:hypothetical protein
MSRGPHTFKQRDVTRAIKAYVKAGIPIERIRTEFDKQGRFVVSVAKLDEADRAHDAWDDAIAALEAQ